MEEIIQDQQIQVIQKEISPIQEKVANLQINDEPSSKYATDLLAFIVRAKKRIEERRQFFVRPLNDHVKDINVEFKRILTPLDTMEQIIKTKLLDFKVCEDERLKQETEEKNRKLKELAEKEGLPLVTADETRASPTIKSAIGTSSIKKIWTWEVVDINLIPREYLTLDETKINNLVRAHVKVVQGINSCDLEIEGIRIFQKDIVAIRI